MEGLARGEGVCLGEEWEKVIWRTWDGDSTRCALWGEAGCR